MKDLFFRNRSLLYDSLPLLLKHISERILEREVGLSKITCHFMKGLMAALMYVVKQCFQKEKLLE